VKKPLLFTRKDIDVFQTVRGNSESARCHVFSAPLSGETTAHSEVPIDSSRATLTREANHFGWQNATLAVAVKK